MTISLTMACIWAFLANILKHPAFAAGEATTAFIGDEFAADLVEGAGEHLFRVRAVAHQQGLGPGLAAAQGRVAGGRLLDPGRSQKLLECRTHGVHIERRVVAVCGARGGWSHGRESTT